MNRWLDKVYWGNTVEHWLVSMIVLFVGIVVVKLIKRTILSALKRWASRTVTNADDFVLSTVDKAVIPMAYLGVFYVAFLQLRTSAGVQKVVSIALMTATMFFVVRIITGIVQHGIYTFIKRQANSAVKEKQARGLIVIFNIIIWTLGVIFLIDNLGYNVTTLITGLGIGGIAIALAAQTVLGDLFSYFVIFFDRPFEIGDFISMGEESGTVEYVGIKTTRIRTLSGEQLVCSNKDLTDSRVHNYGRMSRRRVVFTLKVEYATDVARLEQIPAMVKSIILANEKTTFDRGNFSNFGDSSLDFEFVYFIETADYNYYMDIQQRVYLEIVKLFSRQDIKFAYPTLTVLVPGGSDDTASQSQRIKEY